MMGRSQHPQHHLQQQFYKLMHHQSILNASAYHQFKTHQFHQAGQLLAHPHHSTGIGHQQIQQQVITNDLNRGNGSCNDISSSLVASTNSLNSNSKRKRTWSRAVFTQLQRKGLEIQFGVQKYITKPDRRKLAANLGLTDAQVSILTLNGYCIDTE